MEKPPHKRPSTRLRRLSWITVAAAICAMAACASAFGASACSDFSRPACSIRLSTGITMNYREIGPRDGSAVFLLHGYSDSSHSWELVLPVLHRLLPGSDIIVPDLRGHGGTSMPSGAGCAAAPENCFTWRNFAGDIVSFMDARHIRRAAIVAHSMGTLVAQELGLSYPSRVSRLVLVSTAAAGQEPAVEFLLDQVVEGLWRDAFVAAGYSWPGDVYNLSPAVAAPGFSDFIDNQWVTSSVAPQWFLDQTRRLTSAVRLGTWIGPLKQIYATDNTERLRHLTVPTLVLYATQDDIFSPADEQTLIDSLTAAAAGGGSFWWKEYGQLPPTASGEQTDLGHNLPWEAPNGVATDIASFLERGRPTLTLYHTDYPSDIHRVIAEPGRALVIHEP
jgi:pimeloyl-ACP methyl ester carboxylesterase